MGPRPGRVHLHVLLGRLPHRDRVVPQPRSCATTASTSTRSTGAGCATRAGSASRRSTTRTASARRCVRARRRRRAGRGPLGRRARRGRRRDRGRPRAHRARRARGARRRPAHQRGRLRLGQAGQGRASAPTTSTPSSATASRPSVVLGLPRATIDEVCAAGRHRAACSGPDLKEELPVLFLRLRHAVVEDGVKVVELAQHDTERRPSWPRRRCATGPARRSSSCRPLLDGGRPAGRGRRRRRAPAPATCCGPAPVTVVLGRPSLAESRRRQRRRGRPPARRARRRPLPAGAAPRQRPRRARHGPRARAAARAGQPRRRPATGSRRLADGARPSAGLDATGILAGRGRRPDRHARAARRRPARRLPRPRPRGPRRWPAPARSSPSTRSSPRPSAQADVVLPAAGYAEVDGTTTNLEGRISSARPEGHPAGHRPDRLDDRRRAGLPPRRRPRPRVGRGHLGRDRAPRPVPRRHHPASCSPRRTGRRRGRPARQRAEPGRAVRPAAGRHVVPAGDPDRVEPDAGTAARARRGERPTPTRRPPTPRPRPRTTRRGAGRRGRGSGARRREAVAEGGRASEPSPEPTNRTMRRAEPMRVGDAPARQPWREPAPLRRCGTSHAVATARPAPSTPTRCGSSPPASSTTAARSSSTAASLAGLAAAPALAGQPVRPRPPRVCPTAHRVAVTSARASLVDDRGHRPVAAPRHRRRSCSTVATRRRPMLIDATATGHRHPGGDQVVMFAADPLLVRRHRPRRRRSSCCSRRSITFVFLLVATMLMIWFERKVIGDMQNRIGPNRAGPLGHPPDPGRRHQGLLQGGPDPRPGRPTRLQARAVPVAGARRSSCSP